MSHAPSVDDRRRRATLQRVLGTMLASLAFPAPAQTTKAPVLLGLDAEFGNRTSTADDAIRAGIEIALEEIGRRGGVLGGRRLELVTRDNRGVPARGVDNLQDLARIPDMTAVVTSKFSAVVLAQIGPAHALEIPLLAAWSAADGVVDHGHRPSYTFRLSLRDSWVMQRLLSEGRRRGFKRVGLMVPNGAWGRSNVQAAEAHAARAPGPKIVRVVGFEWSDASLQTEYLELLKAGAEAIVFVGNEPEAALLLKDMTALPRDLWRPILSHWGVAAGDLQALASPALFEVDLTTVQTFSFIDNSAPKARRVLEAAMKRLAVSEPTRLLSPVGVAHGYDLTHILALAIDKAGSTDRTRIRDALEQLGTYDGLVRKYAPPFTVDRHEALGPEQLFAARWRRDGAIVRVAR